MTQNLQALEPFEDEHESEQPFDSGFPAVEENVLGMLSEMRRGLLAAMRHRLLSEIHHQYLLIKNHIGVRSSRHLLVVRLSRWGEYVRNLNSDFDPLHLRSSPCLPSVKACCLRSENQTFLRLFLGKGDSQVKLSAEADYCFEMEKFEVR